MKANKNTKFLLLLRNAGYTQATFATKIGLTSACVSKWVTGKSYPTIEHVNEIAKILKTSVDKVNETFFGGE